MHSRYVYPKTFYYCKQKLSMLYSVTSDNFSSPFCDCGLCHKRNLTGKAHSTERKTDFIKMENFGVWKITAKIWKQNLQDERICLDIIDLKEFNFQNIWLTLTTQQQTDNLTKECAKKTEQTFLQQMHEWQIDTWKDTQQL